MTKDPGSLLYQPNLTCQFVLTMTPDGRMRVLTVSNKDPIGINDSQTVTSLWDYARNFGERLRKETVVTRDTPPKVHMPELSIFLNRNEKRDVYSLVMVSEAEDIMIDDMVYMIAIGQFCGSMAKQLGLTLEGTNEGHTSGPTSGREAGL